MNEVPNGRTRMTTKERQTILSMRLQMYSIKQIAKETGRSETSVKRVIYSYDYQKKVN
jgi:IS30 family transposase